MNVNSQVTATAGGGGGAAFGGSATNLSGPSWSSLLMGIDWSNGTTGTGQLAGYMQAYGKSIQDVQSVYSWFTVQQLADHMKQYGYGNMVPGFEARGFHAGGLRMVGEGGVEIEATGPARYWNHSQTREMLSGGGDLAGKIDTLIAVLQNYAKQALANGGAIAAAMAVA